MDSTTPPFGKIQAPADWRCAEFISDLHLHPDEQQTFRAWRHYLESTAADALFILGDLFEVWVGDDVTGDADGFEALCAKLLTQAAMVRPVYLMHGNRDFLIGSGFCQQTRVQLMDDPTVLCLGTERVLLSHGDSLCLSDTDYQAFRTEVRSSRWQQDFLARPLAERSRIARDLRNRSEARKRLSDHAGFHDLDLASVRRWLGLAGAHTLVHGHTHRPAHQSLGAGLSRVVLSDWDMAASPPRAQVLRLSIDKDTGLPTFSRHDLG